MNQFETCKNSKKKKHEFIRINGGNKGMGKGKAMRQNIKQYILYNICTSLINEKFNQRETGTTN